MIRSGHSSAQKTLCLMVAPVPFFINGEVNSEAAIDKKRSRGCEESEAGHKRQEEKTMNKKEILLQGYTVMRDFWIQIKDDERLDSWNGKVFNKRFQRFIEGMYETAAGFRFTAVMKEWGEVKQLLLTIEDNRPKGKWSSVPLYIRHGKYSAHIGILDITEKRIDISIVRGEIQKQIDYLTKRIEVLSVFQEEEMTNLKDKLNNAIADYNYKVPFEFSELCI